MTTAVQIRKKLASLKRLPAKVKNWRVESGEDNTGDTALWVWVTLNDVDLSEQNREGIREAVRRAVRAMPDPVPSWVYVRFQGASEDAA